MKPKKACLSVLKGIFDETKSCYWIGPWFFNIWGKPKNKKLKTATKEEMNFIGDTAEKIYDKIEKKLKDFTS